MATQLMQDGTQLTKGHCPPLAHCGGGGGGWRGLLLPVCLPCLAQLWDIASQDSSQCEILPDYKNKKESELLHPTGFILKNKR